MLQLDNLTAIKSETAPSFSFYGYSFAEINVYWRWQESIAIQINSKMLCKFMKSWVIHLLRAGSLDIVRIIIFSERDSVILQQIGKYLTKYIVSQKFWILNSSTQISNKQLRQFMTASVAVVNNIQDFTFLDKLRSENKCRLMISNFSLNCQIAIQKYIDHYPAFEISTECKFLKVRKF